jgi:hypothetical protein
MPIRYRCPSCNTLQKARDVEARNKVPCPSCGQRIQLPAPADRAAIRVQVSARILLWPQKCVCCCGESDSALQLVNIHATGKTEKEVAWEVPYCSHCLGHVRREPSATVKESCCSAEVAVIYDGYRGTVHTFRFFNAAYAERFIKANEKKVLG